MTGAQQHHRRVVRVRHRGAHPTSPRRAKPRGRPQAPDACASLRQSPAPRQIIPLRSAGCDPAADAHPCATTHPATQQKSRTDHMHCDAFAQRLLCRVGVGGGWSLCCRRSPAGERRAWCSGWLPVAMDVTLTCTGLASWRGCLTADLSVCCCRSRPGRRWWPDQKPVRLGSPRGVTHHSLALRGSYCPGRVPTVKPPEQEVVSHAGRPS